MTAIRLRSRPVPRRATRHPEPHRLPHGSGLAGITEIGNVGQALRFLGGASASWPTNTSPFWPYTLIDSVFEGQREAAIREHLAGLTVVRTTFRNVPVGIRIDEEYSDHLWLNDTRFERVGTAAIVFDQPQNAPTQIGVEGASARHAGLCALPRERSDRRHAAAVPRPALQPWAVRTRERQHGPHRAALRRRTAGGGACAAASALSVLPAM